MIKNVLLLPLALLALSCATLGESQRFGSTQTEQKELFLCPSRPAVCSWSRESGWKVLWTAQPDVERERLSLWLGGRGLSVLWQKSPYGGTFLVFSRDGRMIAAADQGVPLGIGPAVGEEDGGAIVLCTGRDLDKVACSTWIRGENALTQGTPPIYPAGCLFPRSLEGTSFCVEDTNPFRDPGLPLHLLIREMPPGQDSKEHRLSLPAGFLSDFMPLERGRALFAYEDGRVFKVGAWSEVTGPIASGVLRLQRLRNRVYLLAGPSLVEQGAVLLKEDGDVLRTLWTGREVPREMTAPSEGSLLLRVEEPEGHLSRIILLGPTREGTVPEVLFEEQPPNK